MRSTYIGRSIHESGECQKVLNFSHQSRFRRLPDLAPPRKKLYSSVLAFLFVEFNTPRERNSVQAVLDYSYIYTLGSQVTYKNT